ncbi:MAG TPA: hypothetical protein PLN91_00810 [Rhodanobacteraceae bacterium]|nr:hypothetical protein [Rhodanobacteraceae bacterium]
MKRWFNRLGLCLAAAAALAGCGGGGTKQAAVDSAVTATKYSIALSLRDANDIPTNHFSAGVQASVVATVTQTVTKTSASTVISNTTGPAANVLVKFDTNGATVTPASGTVLTDNSGSARAQLLVGADAGGFALNASVQGSSGEGGGAATINYIVDRTLEPRLTLTLTNQKGEATTRLQSGEIATVQVKAELIQQVVGKPGGELVPAKGVTVTVASDGGTFDPSNGAVLTDDNGMAQVRFQPSLAEGAHSMGATAKVDGKSVATSLSYEVRMPVLRLGWGTPFQAGVLDVSPTTVIGGTDAALRVKVLDADGNPFPLPVSIAFTSSCATLGTAGFVTPVQAIGGNASSVYTPRQGCVGRDTLRAQALLPGQTIPVTASADVTVVPPPASGVAYVSATPTTIALKGHARAALPETSVVVFRVIGNGGVGVPGQNVQFTLSSSAGGLSLRPSSGVSDNNGEVRTTVTSGSVATTFTVRASLGSGSGTESEPLLVSSGAADQDSVSLSASTLNVEGWDFDGSLSLISVRLADHFNNPVPDGTVVSFTAEGGSVTPSCTTSAGVCTATLQSQNPRPADGRVSVLATVVGDESFTDTNGNGLYDAGEAYGDIGEPFRDDNENRVRDASEPFIDANGNNRWDGPNGRYDGSPCNLGNGCSPASTQVGRNMVIVFSTSAAIIQINPGTIKADDVTAAPVQILVSDLHGNLPPRDSTITVTTSNGKLLNEVNTTVANSNSAGPLVLSTAVIGDGTPSSGLLTVEVKTPAGTVTRNQATVIDTKHQAQVGTLTFNPASTTVASSTTVDVATILTATSTDTPPQPIVGATPVANCSTAGATGTVTVTLDPTIQPTDTNGSTRLTFHVTTGAGVSGSAVCTATLGSKSAPFKINLGP